MPSNLTGKAARVNIQLRLIRSHIRNAEALKESGLRVDRRQALGDAQRGAVPERIGYRRGLRNFSAAVAKSIAAAGKARIGYGAARIKRGVSTGAAPQGHFSARSHQRRGRAVDDHVL